MSVFLYQASAPSSSYKFHTMSHQIQVLNPRPLNGWKRQNCPAWSQEKTRGRQAISSQLLPNSDQSACLPAIWGRASRGSGTGLTSTDDFVVQRPSSKSKLVMLCDVKMSAGTLIVYASDIRIHEYKNVDMDGNDTCSNTTSQEQSSANTVADVGWYVTQVPIS